MEKNNGELIVILISLELAVIATHKNKGQYLLEILAFSGLRQTIQCTEAT